MKAMILAAGRGERMRPLTDTCPKPLLKVAGVPLIEHHLIKLAKIGITDIVINTAWLAEKIVSHLGNGEQFNVSITYSPEKNGALETAGGIVNALPLLATLANSQGRHDQLSAPFLLINGDVYTDFDFTELPKLADNCLAHIFLIKNPEHNSQGDFVFQQGQLSNINSAQEPSMPLNEKTYTFSGISLFRAEFFQQEQQYGKVIALGPLLKDAIERKTVCASLLPSLWVDVGTPERLQQLNNQLAC